MRLILKLASFFLLASICGLAQGSRYDSVALLPTGGVISFASIRVCAENATGTPCTPLATTYTDKTLTTIASNPFTADLLANYHFFAAPGWYTVQVSATGTGVSAYTYKVLLAPDVSNMGAISTGPITATSLTISGTPLLRTLTASNSDVTGELVFAAATTATYTWVNTYISHPECVITPQFDLGATPPRSWVTYSGITSFTINYSAAVTGTVGYICIGRN